jgi:nicotinate dehydrogenase subunit B
MTIAFSLRRRDLLRGAVPLIVGFNLGLDGNLKSAAASPGSHDPKNANAWIVINKDETAQVYFGKVELGQGNSTTLLQLVAEELDLDMSRMSAVQVDTAHSMNQGATVSSSSIQQAGPQLRAAAAEIRQELLRRAAAKLDTPVDQLTIANGIVTGAGKTCSYGALIQEGDEHIPITGSAPLKDVASYKVVGSRLPRRDIPAKVNGSYEFVHHARLPDMLHGRVVRPRGQGGYGHPPKVRSIDEASLKGLPGVQIIRQNDFIGVVAERQWDAVRAARQLKVDWDLPASLPGNDQLHAKLRSAKTVDSTMLETGNVKDATSDYVVKDVFHGPYQAHGPFGPSCALADVKPDSVLLQCSSQDVFALRTRAAALIKLPEDKVRVQFLEGSGCFGHSCFDDAALAAAVMSKSVGRPVRVQFMRWDELGWDNYGPSHVGEVRIGANHDGHLTVYEYRGWHHGWLTEETTEYLVTGQPVQETATGAGSLFVNKFDAGGMYDIPNRLLLNHAVPGLDGFLKGANLRSPLDLSYSFASEQLIDRLARLCGIDPVEFRRRNIKDPRWRGVLDAIVQASNWQSSPSRLPNDGPIVRGRGVALGTHRASMGGAVVDIELDKRSGVIVVKHVYAALDCGIAVNPAVVEAQIAGMSTQAVSRVLKEEVQFSETGVTSLDWVSYPVLRFGEHPEVTPIVVAQKGPSLGAGEEALAAVGAAVANAFYDATGLQLTTYPMTPRRVLDVLQASARNG